MFIEMSSALVWTSCMNCRNKFAMWFCLIKMWFGVWFVVTFVHLLVRLVGLIFQFQIIIFLNILRNNFNESTGQKWFAPRQNRAVIRDDHAWIGTNAMISLMIPWIIIVLRYGFVIWDWSEIEIKTSVTVNVFENLFDDVIN